MLNNVKYFEFNSYYGFDVDYERFRSENERGLIAALYPSGSFSRMASGDPSIHQRAPLRNREVLRAQIREEGAVNFVKRVGKENKKYFILRDVLFEPGAMLTETPRLPGTDGRKMSKSYGNAIELGESDESIGAKTKVMMTDPARKRRTDKGNPDVCPVYDWHKLFSPPDVLAWSNQGCRTAGIGCIECKAAMADHLIRWITPIRERRNKYEKQPDQVLQILDEGSKKAREVAGETMRRVREAVFGWEKKRAEISGTPAATTNAKAGN